MMHRLLLTLSLSFLVSANTNANAGSPWTMANRPLDLNYLYLACKEARDKGTAYSRGFCEGAVKAALTEVEQQCLPEDSTWGEVKGHLVDVIVNLELPPGISPIKVPDFLEKSLMIKWPCNEM